MNVNLHLSGELEEFINELVKRGIAANKTEAIRFAIARYYEEQQVVRKNVNEELLEHSTARAHWDNAADEKSSKFYKKRYLHD
jgi:Arc/MetJ-type ribon-helix-helix transcriptional regulator